MIYDNITGQPCIMVDVTNEMGCTVFVVRLGDGEIVRRKCGEIKYTEDVPK